MGGEGGGGERGDGGGLGRFQSHEAAGVKVF